MRSTAKLAFRSCVLLEPVESVAFESNLLPFDRPARAVVSTLSIGSFKYFLKNTFSDGKHAHTMPI